MPRLYAREDGKGSPLVLLHGMAASHRYWDDLVALLRRKYRVIRLDLLGFGRSPKPRNITYNYQNHIDSILATLDQLDLYKPVTLVGHSMGALLALRFTRLHPERIKKLVLVGLPYYENAQAAQLGLTQGKWYKQLAYYGPTSRLLCTAWCRGLRPLSRHLARLYLRKLPRAVAEDSVLHTWRSYSQSRDLVIGQQEVLGDLQHSAVPTILIYGRDEDHTKQLHANDLQHLRNVQLVTVSGGHNVPLDNPAEVVKIISRL